MTIPVNSFVVNPIAFVYGSEVNIQAYYAPSAALVSSRGNVFDTAMQTARLHGARVLAYLDPVEASIVNSSPLDTALYGPSGTAPPWPYKDANGATRVNFAGDYLLDIQADSVWSNDVVAYVETLIRGGKADGVMLDVLGSRLWSILAAWTTWPVAEQRLWVAGCVSLVQKLDTLRRRLNPRFIIINNNTWLDDALGKAGMAAVNGWVLEHHIAFTINGALTGTAVLASLPTAPGLERFMVAIATTQAEALNWAKVPGITNVSSQAGYRGDLPPPPVPAISLSSGLQPSSPGSIGIVGATSTLGLA